MAKSYAWPPEPHRSSVQHVSKWIRVIVRDEAADEPPLGELRNLSEYRPGDEIEIQDVGTVRVVRTEMDMRTDGQVQSVYVKRMT